MCSSHDRIVDVFDWICHPAARSSAAAAASRQKRAKAGMGLADTGAGGTVAMHVVLCAGVVLRAALHP